MNNRTLSKHQLMYVDYVMSLRPGTVRCSVCGMPFRVRNDIAFMLPEADPAHVECCTSKFIYHKNQAVKSQTFSLPTHVPRERRNENTA